MVSADFYVAPMVNEEMAESKKALKERMGNLVHENRVLIEEANKENRTFTAEEEQTYQRIDREITEIELELQQIERTEKQEAREAWLDERERAPVPRPAPTDNPHITTERPADDPLGSNEYHSAFFQYIRTGTPRDQYEQRALSQGSDPGGGYTVPQQQFVRELIQKLDDTMPMRGMARGFQVTDAKSLGAPALETDPADADWTSELATGGEDSSMAFGARELIPHPLAKRLKVSNKLLANSALPIDDIIRDRLTHIVYAPLETAYMTGDGNNKPLGIFTASASGISTARDVEVGDGSDGISGTTSAGKFITAAHTLRVPYWNNARWIFNRLILAALRKLIDTNSTNYLWQPGLSQMAPATFLGFPYTISEYAPGTIGDQAYVAVLGDFQYYWYADSLNIRLQRLVELYAETNQTGFIVRGEFDGMPVMEDAFVRCQTAKT